MIDIFGFKIKPLHFGLLSALLALLSLIGAWTAQYGFGLMPCKLCLMQRWPYYIIILLSLIAAVPLRSKRVSYAITSFFIAITYAVGGSIAAFHSGVERHWWEYSSDCTASAASTTKSAEDFLAAIKSAPAVRCDEIPWQIFGLSFANLNFLYSTGMALLIAWIAIGILRHR